MALFVYSDFFALYTYRPGTAMNSCNRTFFRNNKSYEEKNRNENEYGTIWIFENQCFVISVMCFRSMVGFVIFYSGVFTSPVSVYG